MSVIPAHFQDHLVRTVKVSIKFPFASTNYMHICWLFFSHPFGSVLYVHLYHMPWCLVPGAWCAVHSSCAYVCVYENCVAPNGWHFGGQDGFLWNCFQIKGACRTLCACVCLCVCAYWPYVCLCACVNRICFTDIR